jgi:hypothetical protein
MMDRIRLTVLSLALPACLLAALPARTDQACQAALATISRATDTLTKLQDQLAAIETRRQQAPSATVTAPGAPEKQGSFVFIDLQPKANHALAQDQHDTEGNNLKGVPQGEQKLAGVSYKIGPRMVHLRGAHAMDLPEKVEGIPIGTAVSRLHFLHGNGYNLDSNTEIGAYLVHYADGTSERIPLLYGEDIHDWWGASDLQNLKRARIAWKGTNPAADSNQMSIYLYALDWINPHPDKPIRSLDIISRNTECDPFLVALSVEKP